MKFLEAYLEKIFSYFEKQSGFLINLIGSIFVVFVGVIDYLAGYEIELAIFYLIPIAFVTWLAGKRSGTLISIVSTIIIFLADMLAGKVFSHPLIGSWNTLATLGIFLIIVFSLSSLKNALKEEQMSARTDSLTGVANSGYFKLLTDLEVERCRRYNSSFTFAYIDCDNFKFINDKFGHNTGDDLLILLAETVRENIRITDIVARLGGDEFGILLPETGKEQGQAVIVKIQKMLLEVMEENGWPVTVSIGAVTYLNAPTAADEVIKSADNLMYAVKSSGKNSLKHETYS
ncbi:MAG: GGDEF domain-containing protein [Syntrophales bacterium]